MEYNENNEPIFVRVPKDEALNKFAPSPPPPKAVRFFGQYAICYFLNNIYHIYRCKVIMNMTL